MTVDTRAIVFSNIGTVVSGSVSDDHIDGTNALVKTKGTITVNGIKNLARGSVVRLGYMVPGYGQITRFPRRLRVLSTHVDPFEEVTTVEVGCMFTLKADLRSTEAAMATDVQPDWVASLPENQRQVLPWPLYAKNVLSMCLQRLGLTTAAGSAVLASQFLRQSMDLSNGYVQTINDLLLSESCYGFLNAGEQFVVRKIVPTSVAGPVLTRNDLITMEGIEGGEPPPDQVRVTWQGAAKAPTGLTFSTVPTPLPLPQVPVPADDPWWTPGEGDEWITPNDPRWVMPADPWWLLEITPAQRTTLNALVETIFDSYDVGRLAARRIVYQGIIESGALPIDGLIPMTDLRITATSAAALTYAEAYEVQMQIVRAYYRTEVTGAG